MGSDKNVAGKTHSRGALITRLNIVAAAANPHALPMCSFLHLSGRNRRLCVFIAAVVVSILPMPWEKMLGQAFSFDLGNFIYNENFNSMGSSGTTFVSGWISEDSSMIAGNGSGSVGSIYNVGTTGASDRAFGALADGNTPAPDLYFGASFANNTGQTIFSFDLAGMMEQWRSGASSGIVERDVFEFSLNATSLTSGTWTALPSFDLVEQLTATTSSAAVNGNTAGNRAAIAGNALVNWATGTRLWIRWGDANDVSFDGLYAVDDFSLAVSLTPPELVWNPGPATWDTNTTNWLAGANSAAFSNLKDVTFTNAGLASGATVAVAAGGVTPGQINVANSTGTYTFMGGAIGGGGTLTKTGGGTLVLATTYSGAVVVNGGILQTGANEVLSDTRTLTIGNSATLDLAGKTETVGGLALAGASVTTGAGTLVLGGDVTITAVTFPTVLSGNLSTGSATRIMSVSDGAASEDVVIDAKVSGAAGMIFTGAGTIRLNADNSAFTGGFRTIGSTGQVIVLGHSRALGDALADLSSTTLRAAVPVTGVDRLMTPIRSQASGVTIDMANLEIGGAMTFGSAGLLRLLVNGPATFSGFLDASAADVTTQKIGTGTLTMSGTGTGVGKFQFDEGTVEVAGQTALGSHLVAFRPVTGRSATLAVTAPTAELGALDDVGSSGSTSVQIGNTSNGTDSNLRLVGPQNATFAGAIRDATGQHGQLTKAGSGTQTLGGANTYTGATNVSGGTLILTGSLSGTSNLAVSAGGGLVCNSTIVTGGGVTVNGDNSFLGGSGQINLGVGGAVVMGPNTRLSPGNATSSTGTLTVSGSPLAGPNATFSSDHSVWAFEISPATPGGSGFDRLSITGDIALNEPTLTLMTNRFEGQVNDLFFIIINDGVDPISGSFSGLPQGATVFTNYPAVTFKITYFGDSTTNSPFGGNDVALLVISAPEPGSLLTIVFGGILLAGRRPVRMPRSLPLA
jgi:autotransporter-associated beta strand protein